MRDPLPALSAVFAGRLLPLPEASGEQAPPVLPLASGARVQARVAERYPDNTFRVMVGGQSVRTALPAGFRTGDTVEMTYLGGGSRPVLALPARQAPAAPAVQISGEARTLTALLATVDRGPSTPASTPAPLLQAPPRSPGELAQAMRSALVISGVFYESHQAEWVQGERPLADLLREPQARLPAGARAGVESGQERAGDDPARTGGPPAPLARPDAERLPDAQELVRRQLDVLDHGRIFWRGELWPGQQAEWEIEQALRERGREAPERAWQTTLSVTLPRLGGVRAMLTLTGNRVAVTLHARDAGSARLLQQASPTFAAALQQADLVSAGVQVKHGDG